jgi:hypothetical protein
MNVIGNGFAIIFILFMIIGFGIGFTVLNPMAVAVHDATYAIDPTTADYYLGVYTNLKAFYISNVTFLFYLMLLLVYYTSFGHPNSIKTYTAMVMGGALSTVIFIQLGTVIWNQFSLQTLLDFSDLSSMMWFVANIQTILIVNFLVSLASFVFIPKPNARDANVVVS